MIKKYWAIFFICFFFSVSLYAQVCPYRNISFRAVNNIQNASLEQDLSTCLTAVSGGDFTLLHSGYLPHWRLTTTSSTIWFLGECNNYAVPPPSPSLPGLPEPSLPIPDGKGMMAFADHVNVGSRPRNVETYLANCLSATLQKDFFYRFDFYLGFGKIDHRYDTIFRGFGASSVLHSSSLSPMPVTLYGFADSNLLPINVPDTITGCLASLRKGWIELGTVTVTGDSGTWIKSSINFTAPANINVLAIGPACNSKSPGTPPGYYYYFVDKLQLYQSYIPNVSISVTAGTSCDGINAFKDLQMDYAAIYQGSKFQWYKNNVAVTNETSGKLTVTKTGYGAGWYQCGVQNDSICLRSDSLYVGWVAPPSPTILGAADISACNGETILLNAASASATYLWEDSSTLATRSITQSGTYAVTISNACDTITVKKNIVFKDCPTSFLVPSGFTPNNDGLNDVFKPHLNGVARQYEFSVYNRSGQRIFTSTDTNKGWDGNYQRIQQPAGTYVWIVNYVDGTNVSHTEKGTVVLIR